MGKCTDMLRCGQIRDLVTGRLDLDSGVTREEVSPEKGLRSSQREGGTGLGTRGVLRKRGSLGQLEAQTEARPAS